MTCRSADDSHDMLSLVQLLKIASKFENLSAANIRWGSKG